MRRKCILPPPGVDLSVLAERVKYVGSPEHKAYPSFAGPPKPRAEATLCDPTLNDQVELTGWIASGLRAGQIGAPWEVDFPRYVWLEIDSVWYEGRLVNPVQGWYKGYALRDEELEDWMKA
jgi:hypothetical protein